MRTTSLCGAGLVRVIALCQMGVIGESSQAEGVTIAELQCFESADGCVSDDESLPLPRSWYESQQVANEHAVGSRVRHEGEAITRFFDVPHGKLVLDPEDSAVGEKLVGSSMDSLGEVTDRFTTFETLPSIERRSPLFLPVGGFSLLRGIALPDRTSDFLQPRLDDLSTTLGIEDRSRGLPRSQEWRYIHVVEVLIFETIGETPRLSVASCGERWVVLAEAVPNPLGFGMTYEGDEHTRTLVVGCGDWRRGHTTRHESGLYDIEQTFIREVGISPTCKHRSQLRCDARRL